MTLIYLCDTGMNSKLEKKDLSLLYVLGTYSVGLD